MLGGRLYTVTTASILVSVAQDLQGYLCAAGRFAMITGYWVEGTDQTLPTPCDLNFSLKLITATVNPGTGGTSAPPAAWPGSGGTPFGTAWQNATTQASSVGGSVSTILPKGCHIFQGQDKILETPVPLLGGQACVLGLDTAPAAASRLSSGLWVVEF